MTKYLADNGIYARYPKVSEQVELLPLDTKALPKYAYNPTVIDHNGMTMLAYRFHDNTLASRLGLATIDADGRVLTNRTLNIGGQSDEDPRFYRTNKHLGMSWVDSTWPVTPPTSIVRCGRFKDGTLCDYFRPELPQNDGTTTAKNYVIFWYDGHPYCIHEPKVYRIETPAVELDRQTLPSWPYGQIRGGAPPVEYEGKYLRFFHSAVDAEWGPQPRRYFVGAYLMDDKPPFNVVRVSTKPILYGSELDDVNPGLRKQIIQHKICVVFPAGVLVRDGHWVVSLGINDCQCALARITPEMLNL